MNRFNPFVDEQHFDEQKKHAVYNYSEHVQQWKTF